MQTVGLTRVHWSLRGLRHQSLLWRGVTGQRSDTVLVGPHSWLEPGLGLERQLLGKLVGRGVYVCVCGGGQDSLSCLGELLSLP